MTETPDSEPLRGNWLEGRKMLFETLKLLTTLSSATFVMIATFMKGANNTATLSFLVRTALVLLVLAPCLTLFVMFGVSNVVTQPLNFSTREGNLYVRLFLLALLSFFAAMVCVVVSIWMH
jgi:hypothetical protein